MKEVRQRRRPTGALTSTTTISSGSAVTNWPVEGPDIRVTYHAIGDLKPPRRQLRMHKPKQLAQIQAQIERHGFINPVIVDAELRIVAGVGRYIAAREIGLQRVPVIKIDHLSEAELRAYAIADNKLVLNDSWNEELLTIELSELMVLDIDLPIELTAFDLVEIDNLLMADDSGEDGPLEPDEEEPVSRTGDLFVLGAHRLYCGDSREEESYERLLGSERARAVFSDNPYNIKIPGNVSGLGRVKHKDFVMASGEMTQTEYTAFLTGVFVPLVKYSIDGAIHFQCIDHRHLREMLDAGEAAYGGPKTLVVWDKQVPGMGSFYRNQFELIFVFKVGTAPHRNTFGLGASGRNRSSIWSYPGANAMRRGRLEDLALHPTVKNLQMVMDAIRDVTHRGEIVLDPFCGASTTIIAAERTGRKARGIELDPKYVDVGIKRWEKLTGREAVHEATGKTFNELAAWRAGAPDEDDDDAEEHDAAIDEDQG